LWDSFQQSIKWSIHLEGSHRSGFFGGKNLSDSFRQSRKWPIHLEGSHHSGSLGGFKHSSISKNVKLTLTQEEYYYGKYYNNFKIHTSNFPELEVFNESQYFACG